MPAWVLMLGLGLGLEAQEAPGVREEPAVALLVVQEELVALEAALLEVVLAVQEQAVWEQEWE